MMRPRLTILIALLLMGGRDLGAMPGASSPHGAARQAQPLPDPSLPAGTVSVLAKEGGRPVRDAPVLLLPAEAWNGTGAPDPSKALQTGRTNEKGRIFLQAAANAGKSVRLAVRLGKTHHASVAFPVPATGGVRFLFATGGAPHGAAGPGAAPAPAPGGLPPGHPPMGRQSTQVKGPTTTDPSGLRLWVGFRVMAIEDGQVYLGLVYDVMNSGTATFVPGSHGLLLPAPVGATHVSVPQDERKARKDDKGVRLVVPVPPGGRPMRVRASCRLPYDAATRPVRLLSALPIVGYVISMRKYRTVRAQGEGLRGGDGRAHGATAETMLLYRAAPQGFPRNEIRFAFVGLPVRSRLRSWPFALLALLLALAGIAAPILWSRRRSADANPATRRFGRGDDPDPQALLRERDRILGLPATERSE